MVCPKLEKGSCKNTKSVCSQKYETKMQLFKKCKFFKRKLFGWGKAKKARADTKAKTKKRR